MAIKFISERHLDQLLDGPFGEFEDDAPEAERWRQLREKVREYLCRFSDEEDGEGVDGSGGFLIEDEHDNTAVIGLEFNDIRLMRREIFLGLAQILTPAFPGFLITVCLIANTDMFNIGILNGTVFVQSHKTMRLIFG